ncbi:SDR family NAD(P)-dependent oxidoreductase [Sphingobium bisphenolivorans]|uniref:SDR family NAD(P)-dependent oxidoreductase n=1 Tax=Sphingobium bisphenolivorans TaxID=1335760 RepID=UPI0003B3D911|nr:SDR family NAD(P)-dependent oxidoreductase [Sphingobium bisphenolivorans]
MKRLEGRIALITGGGSGIGLAFAHALGREGMQIALAGRRLAPLEVAAAELREHGIRALPLELDVVDLSAWQEALRKVERDLGDVALLCNNAAVGDSELVRDADPNWWLYVMKTNVMGPFNGIRTILPRMLERGEESHILNVSSTSAYRANAGMSAYCASKAAVVGLSNALRQELQSTNVGLSLIVPSLTNTEFSENTRRTREAVTGAAPPLDAQIRDIFKQGMGPENVAAQMLKAVLDDKYYVFTHGKSLEVIEGQCQELLAAFDHTDDADFGGDYAAIERAVKTRLHSDDSANDQGKVEDDHGS